MDLCSELLMTNLRSLTARFFLKLFQTVASRFSRAGNQLVLGISMAGTWKKTLNRLTACFRPMSLLTALFVLGPAQVQACAGPA
jgi:hypothetical protein